MALIASKQMIRSVGKARQRVRVQHQVVACADQRGRGRNPASVHRPPRRVRSTQVWRRLSVNSSANSIAVSIGADHDGGERGGIDRKRIPGRDQCDQPGPGPQSAARRQPRRAGRRDVAGNDNGMAARVFVTARPAAPEMTFARMAEMFSKVCG